MPRHAIFSAAAPFAACATRRYRHFVEPSRRIIVCCMMPMALPPLSPVSAMSFLSRRFPSSRLRDAFFSRLPFRQRHAVITPPIFFEHLRRRQRWPPPPDATTDYFFAFTPAPAKVAATRYFQHFRDAFLSLAPRFEAPRKRQIAALPRLLPVFHHTYITPALSLQAYRLYVFTFLPIA